MIMDFIDDVFDFFLDGPGCGCLITIFITFVLISLVGGMVSCSLNIGDKKPQPKKSVTTTATQQYVPDHYDGYTPSW